MSKRPNAPTVLKEKPKKPLTHYFKFRTERLPALKGADNRAGALKQEWENIPEAVKEAEKEKYKAEMEKYTQLMKEWKEGHPNEPKEKSKRKKTKKEDEEDDEEEEEDEEDDDDEEDDNEDDDDEGDEQETSSEFQPSSNGTRSARNDDSDDEDEADDEEDDLAAVGEDPDGYDKAIEIEKGIPEVNEFETMWAKAKNINDRKRVHRCLYVLLCCIVGDGIYEDKRGKEHEMWNKAADEWDAAINNMPSKQWFQDNLFNYMPGKTWSANFVGYCLKMKSKQPTKNFTAKYLVHVPNAVPSTIRHAFWGQHIIKTMKKSKTEINNHLNKYWSDTLKSGESKTGMLQSIRRKQYPRLALTLVKGASNTKKSRKSK